MWQSARELRVAPGSINPPGLGHKPCHFPQTVTILILILLPVAFLLPPRAGAGEIIRGWEVRPHSRPYMAYLHIKRGNNSTQCGGFLVRKNFVLTAAHCHGDSITVTLGAHNIKQQEWSQQVIPMCWQIPHPQYNRETLNNDIMLLQLQKAAALNNNVRHLPLPPANQRVWPGTMCSIAGWGLTSANTEETSETLQEVNLKVQDDRVCRNVLSGKHYEYRSSTMLCAGDPKQPQASFKGDSGGPFVCQGTAKSILSWGPSSGKPPRVYTRVSTFIPWIEETMERLQPQLGIAA